MQEKWHSWFDYRWGLWICATWIACGWFSERRFDLSPAAINSDRWLLLGILFASQCPLLWYSLRTDLVNLTRSHRRRRATWSALVHALLGYSFVTCLLMASYGRVWTLPEIGFRTESPWSWRILFGLICCHLMRLVQSGIARYIEPAAEATPEYIRRSCVNYFLPRGRMAQALELLNCGLLSPIHEEVVYRGFLVYMLGNLTGQVGLAILFGLSLCLAVHLYQGWRAVPAHVIFYVGFILVLYSPAGLLAAIVMHVANNTYHAIMLPRSVQVYLNWLSEERQNRQPSNGETAANSQG